VRKQFRSVILMKKEIHLDLDSDGSPLTTGGDDGKGMRGMTEGE
jgi:hypothetical protein